MPSTPISRVRLDRAGHRCGDVEVKWSSKTGRPEKSASHEGPSPTVNCAASSVAAASSDTQSNAVFASEISEIATPVTERTSWQREQSVSPGPPKLAAVEKHSAIWNQRSRLTVTQSITALQEDICCWPQCRAAFVSTSCRSPKKITFLVRGY